VELPRRPPASRSATWHGSSVPSPPAARLIPALRHWWSPLDTVKGMWATSWASSAWPAAPNPWPGGPRT